MFFAIFLLLATHSQAYRIQGSLDEGKPFVPYEKGFVGHIQDPIAARRTRVNQGYAPSVLLGDSVGHNRLIRCPKMIGPIDDKYYCGRKEYGYCDRRSGTCFCNDGYMGESCDQCDPSHFELGGLCYAKQLCPNDCSNAGECDFHSGKCVCRDHREGEDCSLSKCSTYHKFCTHCNDDKCVECEQGWSVMSDAEMGFQCEPCYRFDPRCLNCNATTCTSCVDLLLLSIHRSGRRPQDLPLPIDELNRELSITVPFGSTQEDAFYDAEHYFLVDDDQRPLNESAVECHQGLNADDSIDCAPYNMTSHIMCGNHGTVTFLSPEYAVREDETHIRLTLQRSGGGVGEVSVSYSIYPITAGYEDVTSTAHYTTNQTVVFQNGQIRASFLVTINDDRIMERNETFSVHLSNPTGGARLGTQQRTIVTIIDDDADRTCTSKTRLSQNDTDLGVIVAGTSLQFTLEAVSCNGEPQASGGDMYKAVARRFVATEEMATDTAPLFVGTFSDNGDGTYLGAVNVTTTGYYELDVYHLIAGGLRGSYFTDAFLSEPRLDLVRTDGTVNFTFGTGPVATFARDFVSVRWEGVILPQFSETYTFLLDIDEHARLWIDDELIIDWWTYSPSTTILRADCELSASNAHDIILEYREFTGNAAARLLWSSENTPLSAIPPSRLFYKEKIGTYGFTVHPASVGAHRSLATGRGVHSGIAGKELAFVIAPNDSFGNFRGWPSEMLHGDRHLDHFQANAVLIGGAVNVPVSIFYNETTRTYHGIYTPITSGLYQLNVTVDFGPGSTDTHHIFGSPFTVDIQPGATFAPQSLAHEGYGHCPEVFSVCPGIYHGMAGRNSTFIIDAYDLHRNKRLVGGDEWSVIVSVDDYSDYHYGFVEDHHNGTFTASIMPIRSGLNELQVTLDGTHIRGSPFQMLVTANSDVGSASFVQEGMVVTALGETVARVEVVEEARWNFRDIIAP